MPVILLTNHYGKAPYDIIRKAVPEGFTLKMLDVADRACLLQAAGEADYLLASGRLSIDREVLEAAPKVKMIQRTGVGLDTLDMEALREAGIPVYVNRGVNSVSVAEHTVMLILSVLKRTAEVDAQLRSGVWKKQDNGVRNHELYQKTVGFVGMGHVGQKTAQMLSGFEVKMLYNCPHRKDPETEEKLGLTWVEEQDTLLAESDVLVLQCPLNEETRGMMGEAAFAKMKPGSILINTARGPLIEEKALIQALDSGKIMGAGLDVFEKEPLGADSPFFQMKNVVLSPHIAGLSCEAFRRMMEGAMQNIAMFDQGRLSEIEERRI